jgi:hypothetical protein
MSHLSCLVGVVAGTLSVYSNEIDVNLWHRADEFKAKAIARRTAEPEEVRFQRDSDEWKWYCLYEEDQPFNEHDLTATISKLRNEVTGDPVAEGAMDIFLSCFYWKFVDYCVGHLQSMTEINQQRFREVLILLAPGLKSTRYMARAVRIIGRDQKDVKIADIQHLPFCLDMFFYAAVKNGQLGRYALADMCIDAFYAPCLSWGDETDERFIVYDIEEATFSGRCFEDSGMRYFVNSIWPNWE